MQYGIIMAPLSTFYLSIFAISLVAFGSSRAIPQLVLCILLDLGMMRSRSVKLGFTFNVLLWSIIIWGVFLLFPFPLDVHAETFPFYAETRNLILRELNIYKYPLALNPSVHLQGLIWLLSNCFLMIYIRSHRKDEEISKINLGLIIIALCFCGFGWLQFLTDASHIYWFSGVPSFARERFFGTMINPNHASYFLGAILPLVFPHLGRHWAKYTLIFFMICKCLESGSLFGVFLRAWFLFSRHASGDTDDPLAKSDDLLEVAAVIHSLLT